MKKTLAVLLVILMLPSMALAAPKGITVEEFFSRLEECPVKFGQGIGEYKKRTTFMTKDPINTDGFMGFTFQNSDIIEVAFGGADNNELLAFFIASFFENEDTQDRLDEGAKMLNTFDVTKALTKKWSKSKTLVFGEYYFDIFLTPAGNISWMWLNKSSKIKDKQAAIDFIPFPEGYPTQQLLQSTSKLRDEQEAAQAEIQATSGVVALSSGEYDCPVHIPAGEYKVTAPQSINLFTYRDGSLKTNEIVSADNEIGRLILIDGDKIEISGGKLTFEPLQ